MSTRVHYPRDMTTEHHPESCCQACGFAADVDAGRVQPHVRGAPIEVDGLADAPQGLTVHVTFKGGARRGVPMTTPVFRIGRAPDNELPLSLAALARRQCELFVEGGRLFVRDLKSSCGTFVNGKRIGAATALHHGDKVFVVDATFEVEVARRSSPS